MKSRSSQAGFTLIELTVALVAGLIVALGIVFLSREATRTFNEETRVSAAEAILRTATDRLRADLARAGYMSTGNILADPLIAHKPGQSNLSNLNNANMNGLKELAALQLTDQGSLANGLPLSALQTPALGPDVLLIGGNMTCAEQFSVQAIQPPSGNCQKIVLSITPAVYRVATAGIGTGPGAGSTELNNVFAPVTGNGATAQFLVRLIDDTGHTQYLATCPRADVAGFGPDGPYVYVDSTDTAILTAADTQGVGGISGIAAGKAQINPVQIVRWEITSTAQEVTTERQFANGLGNVVQSAQVDPNKYDLMRSYVDAWGNVIPQTSEIIAEYAVDFDLAFTVDTSLVGPTAPNIVSYAFEDPANNGWAQSVAGLNPPPASPPVNVGPQRIRSVRARLVTRTALPDRSVNVPVTQYGQQNYLYRYCINAPCATNDGTLRWARARTITTEVALPNNSGSYY